MLRTTTVRGLAAATAAISAFWSPGSDRLGRSNVSEAVVGGEHHGHLRGPGGGHRLGDGAADVGHPEVEDAGDVERGGVGDGVQCSAAGSGGGRRGGSSPTTCRRRGSAGRPPPSARRGSCRRPRCRPPRRCSGPNAARQVAGPGHLRAVPPAGQLDAGGARCGRVEVGRRPSSASSAGTRWARSPAGFEWTRSRRPRWLGGGSTAAAATGSRADRGRTAPWTACDDQVSISPWPAPDAGGQVTGGDRREVRGWWSRRRRSARSSPGPSRRLQGGAAGSRRERRRPRGTSRSPGSRDGSRRRRR